MQAEGVKAPPLVTSSQAEGWLLFNVIKSFRDTNTERVFNRQFVKSYPREIQQRAFMRLNAIDAAVKLEDLRLPPSNRLEALKVIAKENIVSVSTTSGKFVSCGEMGMQNEWSS